MRTRNKKLNGGSNNRQHPHTLEGEKKKESHKAVTIVAFVASLCVCVDGNSEWMPIAGGRWGREGKRREEKGREGGGGRSGIWAEIKCAEFQPGGIVVSTQPNVYGIRGSWRLAALLSNSTSCFRGIIESPPGPLGGPQFDSGSGYIFLFFSLCRCRPPGLKFKEGIP